MCSTQAHPKGQHGSKVLQSNASVCQQPKSKREDRKQKTISTLVACGGQARLCAWCQAGSQLDAGYGTASTRALSNDTEASGLARLYGRADFQGPPLELVEKVRRAIQKEFTLEPVAVPEPSFGLPGNVRTSERISYVEWCVQLETPMQTPFRIGWYRVHRWG